MRLVSLNLSYFRQHQQALIEFPQGLTGIIGSNGAGKSTLVEAIAFALFGSKAVRGRIDDLKTRGVAKSNALAVSLLFEQTGIIYRIERSRDGAELFVGGETQPLIVGTREVSSQVVKILGMDHQEFMATFYTEQKGLEFLSGHKGATERERFIVRIMGFDRLDQVQEMLRADRRDLKSELIGWEAALGERGIFEERIRHEQVEVERARAELNQAESVLLQAQAEVEVQEGRLSELETTRTEYLKTQTELHRVEYLCAEKNSSVLRLDRVREELLSTLPPVERPDLHSDNLSGTCPTCGQELIGSRLGRVEAELGTLKAEHQAHSAKLVALGVVLDQIRFSPEVYAREKSVYDTTSKLRDVARLNRVELQGVLNTKSAMLRRTKADLDQFESKRDELNLAKKRLTLIEEGDRVLTDFRKHLNSGIRPRLAELASEYLSDLTDGRYSMVEVGEDFSPTVWDESGPKPVISGGEEDILNLCLRLALSNMLAERSGSAFSLLILDEVFGSLDESRRNNVLTLLEKLRARFEQILVITHLDDIKDGVENVIMIDYDPELGAVIADQNESLDQAAENY